MKPHPISVCPLTLTETRKLIADIGLRPKKKLGQNFLVDKNMARRVVELAQVRKGDTVVEIGPGLGAITGPMLAAGATVFAVELDPALHGYLNKTLAANFPRNLRLLSGDAVKEPLADFRWHGSKESVPPFKIVANLPYAISSPWMNAVLGGPLPNAMTLMLQKEAADRFIARTGRKELGFITLQIESAFSLDKRQRVSRSCFYPPPAVDSSLCRFSLRTVPYLFSEPAKDIVRKIFTQRRKQIRGICKSEPRLQPWLKLLKEANIPHQTRPEAIPLEMWQELDQLLVKERA